MAGLVSTPFLRRAEKFLKYARIKRLWFGFKCWTSKEELDALQAVMPSMNETERQLLGETLERIIASAVPRAERHSGTKPGFLIPYKFMRRLEKTFREDGLQWRIAQYTQGSGGGDYWGIDGP